MTLAAGSDGVEWTEAGVLRWAGREVEVGRRYLLREGADGWWVFFDDGTPFHPWTPGRTVEHPCGADLYRGVIRLDSLQRWRIAWDVVGPAKRQRIVSRLAGRVGAQPTTLGLPTPQQEDR